jgi:hypothetical protein
MKKLFLSLLVVFIITPSFSFGSIVVITPNGGENWIMGCPYAIQWVTTSPTQVKIELYKSTNAALIFCMTICSMVPANMTSYTWIPPSTLIPGNIYKVKISSLTNTGGFDFSNNNFAINSGTITVVSPNGGETWYKGSAYQILWTDNICTNVRIELWKGGVFNYSITASTPSNGAFTWTIPNNNTLVPGNNYKVKIMSVANSGASNVVYDFSDNFFTISGGYFITVTSPNGGEVWVRGTTRIITWQDNVPWNVKIELWKGGVYNSLITASTPSNGSCYWAIPATIPSGNDYKIRITAMASNASLFDFSDNNFSIIGVAPAASIFDENIIKIYPNPCTNILHIKFLDDSESPVTIDILNMKGELVMQQSLRNFTNNETIDLNTSGLQTGTYLVVVRKDNEIIYRSNFIHNP